MAGILSTITSDSEAKPYKGEQPHLQQTGFIAYQQHNSNPLAQMSGSWLRKHIYVLAFSLPMDILIDPIGSRSGLAESPRPIRVVSVPAPSFFDEMDAVGEVRFAGREGIRAGRRRRSSYGHKRLFKVYWLSCLCGTSKAKPRLCTEKDRRNWKSAVTDLIFSFLGKVQVISKQTTSWWFSKGFRKRRNCCVGRSRATILYGLLRSAQEVIFFLIQSIAAPSFLANRARAFDASDSIPVEWMGLQPLRPASVTARGSEGMKCSFPLINNKRKRLSERRRQKKKMPLSLEMQELRTKLLISEWRTELLTLRLQLHLTSVSSAGSRESG
ncbi:hypothetical protein HAX54_010256 [Datura stramonium]|uniref:Uncharacterized protein n=1 Tax=Datura stramonium TaxID=4076 RepID=A0ABS8RWQ1_DATST|nr:hypothetical protein [Datura stramonium]